MSHPEQTPQLGPSDFDALVMRKIANIAHHGGLIGFGDMHDAMNEIRRLTLPYWDKDECNELQNRWRKSLGA